MSEVERTKTMSEDVRRKSEDERPRTNGGFVWRVRLSSSASRLPADAPRVRGARRRTLALRGPRQSSPSPSGLTLLEVILGLAIFVGSLAVISKLVELGVRGAEYAQLQARAVTLAESKMGEILADVVTLDSSGGDTFPEDPAWSWSLTSSDGPVSGLKWVAITVYPSPTGELAQNRERIEFTLSRWLFDPEYSADLDAAATESSSTTTSNGTAGTGQ